MTGRHSRCPGLTPSHRTAPRDDGGPTRLSPVQQTSQLVRKDGFDVVQLAAGNMAHEDAENRSRDHFRLGIRHRAGERLAHGIEEVVSRHLRRRTPAPAFVIQATDHQRELGAQVDDLGERKAIAQGTVGYWAVALLATLLFLASVVVHELSHALVARLLGADVGRITLFPFGGSTKLARDPRAPRTESMIAAVGPLTSFGLAFLFWRLRSSAGAAEAQLFWLAILDYLKTINLAVGLFNLLPGLPLDGGHLLRAALWRMGADPRRATARASNWGAGIAAALVGIGLLRIFGGAPMTGSCLLLVGIFVRTATQVEDHHVAPRAAVAPPALPSGASGS